MNVNQYTFGPGLLKFDDEDTESLVDKWKTITENYAGLSLTKKEDRLPALSGLASKFAEYFKCGPSDYLAGLWRVGLGPHWRPRAPIKAALSYLTP
jgi:hypothetical protein